MLTRDELRDVRAVLDNYLFWLKMEAQVHADCDDSCTAKGSWAVDLAEVRAALEIINRELNKE